MTEQAWSFLLRRRTYLLSAFILLMVNGVVSWRLLTLEYSSQLDSIEAAYVSISQHIIDHGVHLGWFRQWYEGIPFQNAYPPLLHVLTAWAALLFGSSAAGAHHLVSGIFYCLGPVAAFLLVTRISGKWQVGLSSALLYSLFSPSILLSRSVQSWASGNFDPARLVAIVKFGDSPHVSGFSIALAALWAVDRATEKASAPRVFLAALFCSAVFLTNWLGTAALVLALACYVAAKAVSEWNLKPLPLTAFIGFMAYAIACPWIPPSTILRVQHNAQFVIGQYEMTRQHLLYAAALVGLAIPLAWLLRRMRASVLTAFGLFYTYITSALVLGSDRLSISLLPQPHRYHVEMDFALNLVIICLGYRIASRIQHTQIRRAGVLVAIVLTLLQTNHARRIANANIQPANIQESVEYKIGAWLRRNMPEKRVFITGSTQFWMNAFAETSQIGGGFGQGIVNDQIPVVHFGIPWMTGDGPGAYDWLQLHGASAVVVSEPTGKDAYHDVWRDPMKFKGVLPELYRIGGDVIYGVPLQSPSLAHAIPTSAIAQGSPSNMLDFAPVAKLLNALKGEIPPGLKFSWVSPSHVSINGAVQREQSVFVQVTYHPGWQAKMGDRQIAIHRDGMGFMVLQPPCDGPCSLDLYYDGGPEMRIALLCSLSTLAVGLFLTLRKRFFWRAKL